MFGFRSTSQPLLLLAHKRGRSLLANLWEYSWICLTYINMDQGNYNPVGWKLRLILFISLEHVLFGHVFWEHDQHE